MGCGYSMPESIKDEILEIEHASISQKSREKYNKKYITKYNKAVTMWG